MSEKEPYPILELIEEVPEPGDEKGIRVLLVEDDCDFAKLVAQLLLRDPNERFVIEHVTRMHEAIESLTHNTYDVMLLDLGLPDACGDHTIEVACEWGRGLPIIVLTATDDDDLALRAIEAGAEEYLVKGDIKKKTLVPRILRAITRHRRG